MTFTFSIVLIVYLTIILGIAVWSARHTRTEVDFLAAGRSIGPFVGGAVLAATQISAGTLVGTLGRHYLAGVSWWYIWFGVWAGWMVSAFFVAPKLRRFGALTVPDYVAVRFGSERARALAAVLIMVSYSILLVAQFQASGEIAQAIFGLEPITAMAFLVISTSLYTLTGGVRSSSYIDFLQALIIVAALLVAVPILWHHAGGLRTSISFLNSLDSRLLGWYYGPKELIAAGASFGLSIIVAPYELTRFYSMRDERTVKRAIGVSIGFQFVIGVSVLLLGLFTRVLFPHLASIDHASSIMAFEVLPPVIGSLLIIAMASAIMSTVNSILLVTGAAFAHDLYARFLNPTAGDIHRINVNRIAIVVLAIIPMVFALQRLGDVQSIVVAQTKFIASFFFVPVLLGLNWRGGTAAGAIAAMVGGFLACLVWELTGQRGFATHGIDAVEVGVAMSLVLYLVVSKFTPAVAVENVRRFFRSDGGGQADRRTGGQADRRTGGRADRRAGGQADRRAGGRAGGRTGGRAIRRSGGPAAPNPQPVRGTDRRRTARPPVRLTASLPVSLSIRAVECDNIDFPHRVLDFIEVVSTRPNPNAASPSVAASRTDH